MKFRQLGKTGTSISAIGLGCWGMSGAYGQADANESIRVIARALDAGVTLFDTADVYGDGRNEEFVGSVLKKHRDRVVIATKFGFVADGHGGLAVNGRRDYVKKACEASLKRLQTDCIDLYFLHRIDKQTPIEETVQAMADLVKEGKVKHIGLSEAGVGNLRRANRVHPLAALQSEYSLFTRDVEAEVLPACRELGITLIAFSPLGRGMLAGKIAKVAIGKDDYRNTLPRFAGENFRENQAIVGRLAAMAEAKNLTPAQLALAWLSAQGESVVPIPGTTKVENLEENLKALAVSLTKDEEELLRAVTAGICGERHDATNSKFFDR